MHYRSIIINVFEIAVNTCLEQLHFKLRPKESFRVALKKYVFAPSYFKVWSRHPTVIDANGAYYIPNIFHLKHTLESG